MKPTIDTTKTRGYIGYIISVLVGPNEYFSYDLVYIKTHPQ